MTPLTFQQALEAVDTFEAFPFFSSQVGTGARQLIAKELMRLANHDIEAIVDRVCAKHSTSRDLLLVKPTGERSLEQRDARAAREALCDIFGGFGYSLEELRRYIFISDRVAKDNFRRRLPHEPKERLDVFVPWFVATNPNGFPGMNELQILWGAEFCCADGSSENRTSEVPGHTAKDHESGNIVPMIAVATEPEYKLLPGERLTDEERNQMAGEFAGALAKLAGNHCNVGVGE